MIRRKLQRSGVTFRTNTSQLVGVAYKVFNREQQKKDASKMPLSWGGSTEYPKGKSPGGREGTLEEGMMHLWQERQHEEMIALGQNIRRKMIKVESLSYGRDDHGDQGQGPGLIWT